MRLQPAAGSALRGGDRSRAVPLLRDGVRRHRRRCDLPIANNQNVWNNRTPHACAPTTSGPAPPAFVVCAAGTAVPRHGTPGTVRVLGFVGEFPAGGRSEWR